MDSNAGTGRTGHELWTAMRELEEQDMNYGQQCGDWKNSWIMDNNTGTGWTGGTGRGLWTAMWGMTGYGQPFGDQRYALLFVLTRAILKGLTLGNFAFDVCVCMVWFTFVYRLILKL